MKQRTTILAVSIAALLASGMGGAPARAQLAEPLRIGNQAPLTDVFGRNLDSVAYEPSCRVDFFTVELGRPAKFLTNTVVGASAMPHRGNFSATLPSRPAVGTTIRAVAYDAATSNEASFYRSAKATVPASGSVSMDFGPLQPMSKFSSDADAAYADALDRLRLSGTDSDKDGMTDYAEVLAGTELGDAASLLAFEAIEPAASQARDASRDADDEGGFAVVELQWQSVPGRTYQIQYTPSLLPDEEGHVPWSDVGGPITAEDEDTSIRIAVELAEEEAFLRGHFRILLVF